ncbi:PREDICTED: bifunctional lysine-specific demethylase and histidyl-hydroxylase MINA-like [Branchiostoma belcheri]|uniref:Bifunctional lysine-specific demethylase and histidyl-hydroxylase n=1 Tax=Branchiostoma belcheri TaxID=7741 RepID=A0A6P4XYC6_BRABE|nr:PREDICTED: bifunctional lysine-specific demethylase and histidyl-hydroxylase MINA-like [Branchiostoma belcheri]
MKPSHIQKKRQKRRENRRKSREKKKLWNLINESLTLGTSTDTKSFPEQDSKVGQETTQIFVSGDKNHRDMVNQNKKKKKEKQLPKLKQPSPSETSETIKSPQKAKRKAKHLKEKGQPLVEKSSFMDPAQHTKQKTSPEKRPLSQSKEEPTSAKRLKTKKIVEKGGLKTVSGSGVTARFDLSSPQKLFKSIISPVSYYEQFFADYWEKKPLIGKRNDTALTEEYKALFSRDILKRLLKKQEIEYIRDVNVCRYVNGRRESLNGTGRATCKQIDKLFDQSRATLQFHQPQRFQDKLWQLCSLLECLFGCLVGANVYMTPPGSQGLAPHYDDVEVFILQLEGRKHWRLYTPPVDLPRDYSRDLEQDSIGQPIHDFVLEDTSQPLASPKGTPPSLNSFIKMRFPGYMALCSQPAETQDDDDEEEDDYDDDDDDDNDGDHEEDDEDGDDDDDHDEEEDDDDDEEEDEDDSITAADDDKDRGREKSPQSDQEWVYLYHCLHNRREEHMMGTSRDQPQGLKFPATFLPVLQKLVKMGREDRVQVKGLGLEPEDNLQVATYLWAEGLIVIC